MMVWSMSTLKDYRSIILLDDDGQPISTMNVHKSIDDTDVLRIFTIYDHEIEKRKMEMKINSLKNRNEDENVVINIIHRLNILKKLVRLDPVMNGLVLQEKIVVQGDIIDLKDYKEKDIMRINTHAYDAFSRGKRINAVRVIETNDEKEFYSSRGVATRMEGFGELVFFVDIKTKNDSVFNISLYSDNEM